MTLLKNREIEGKSSGRALIRDDWCPYKNGAWTQSSVHRGGRSERAGRRWPSTSQGRLEPPEPGEQTLPRGSRRQPTCQDHGLALPAPGDKALLFNHSWVAMLWWPQDGDISFPGEDTEVQRITGDTAGNRKGCGPSREESGGSCGGSLKVSHLLLSNSRLRKCWGPAVGGDRGQPCPSTSQAPFTGTKPNV